MEMHHQPLIGKSRVGGCPMDFAGMESQKTTPLKGVAGLFHQNIRLAFQKKEKLIVFVKVERTLLRPEGSCILGQNILAEAGF
jgi:hypothetical protein